MRRRYEVFDVFTDRPLAGNPLAVVLDAEDIDDEAMQRIAREFNLSETVFVQPPQNGAHTATVRIFTPARELPFAGHPTVGTAVCLAAARFPGPGQHDAVIVLEEKVGPVRCGVKVSDSTGFAEFDCPKLPERAGNPAPKEFITAALDLSPTDLGFENHVPSVWSAGVLYHYVPVRDMEALARSRPNRPAWERAFGTDGAFLYTRQTEGHNHAFRARMYAPEHGIDEDPATGSAVAAFPGAVNEFDGMPDGEFSAIVEQGFEMGRPSLIRLGATISGGKIQAVRIGGNAVRVATGTLSV